MTFSASRFSIITLFQALLFGLVFVLLGKAFAFFLCMSFFFGNVLFWRIFVRVFINGAAKENISPFVVLLCLGKVVISFCVLWMLLERASTLVVVSSNILVASSLIMSCVLQKPKLELYHVE